MARTQAERSDITKRRLLEAAATVFADRGVEGASVDLIADAADRTSGALYGHFGSKAGLLLGLLDSWKSQVAVAAAAELAMARTAEQRAAALWSNFAHPTGPGADRWVRLEHELWRWATVEGNDEARSRLASRYQDARDQLAEALGAWGIPEGQAAVVVALLIGLEMQHRVDPHAVTDAMAVAALTKALRRTR
jgi:AcrR family transcriptional regulator